MIRPSVAPGRGRGTVCCVSELINSDKHPVARALLGTAAGQERDLALPSGKRTFASRRCSNLDQKISDQLDKLGTHAGSPGTLPRLSSVPSLTMFGQLRRLRLYRES
jgi:hypothetical protein